jgi:hypothetical protein
MTAQCKCGGLEVDSDVVARYSPIRMKAAQAFEFCDISARGKYARDPELAVSTIACVNANWETTLRSLHLRNEKITVHILNEH